MENPQSYSLFVYCENDSINCVDPFGNDAVVLFDGDNVGHIGFLAQDATGTWWHFYWGTSGFGDRIACAFGFNVDAYTWCEKYVGEINLESINAAKQFAYTYDDMEYLIGDFSRSISQAKELDEKYNLYSNNCSQGTPENFV